MRFSQYLQSDIFLKSSSITQEEMNKITDIEIENTNEIVFKTPSGKEVPFRKVKYGKNHNDEYAGCDQFICSECGLHLQDWEKIISDGEIEEFEFNFCPNCGADVREMEETE